MNPEGCQKKVFVSEGLATYNHQCKRKWVVTRDGKKYCRIHDPEYVKEKEAKRKAEWDARWAASEACYARGQAVFKATEGLTLDELKQVTPEMIRVAIRLHQIAAGLYPGDTYTEGSLRITVTGVKP